MASLSDYMARYDREHKNPWNKVCHGIGIPLILGGIVLLAFLQWKLGLALVVGGWGSCSRGIGLRAINQPFFKV